VITDRPYTVIKLQFFTVFIKKHVTKVHATRLRTVTAKIKKVK